MHCNLANLTYNQQITGDITEFSGSVFTEKEIAKNNSFSELSVPK